MLAKRLIFGAFYGFNIYIYKKNTAFKENLVCAKSYLAYHFVSNRSVYSSELKKFPN